MKKLTSCFIATLAASSFLFGCATDQNAIQEEQQLKASYQVFTDATWLPEKVIRAPFGAHEVSVKIVEEFKNGIYAFYDDYESSYRLVAGSDANTYNVKEVLSGNKKHALVWSKGASTLFRNGRPVLDWGSASASAMNDGRLLVKVRGKADINYAIKLIAFDITGKPVRQFIRDPNNLPDELAWYVNADYIFPEGSRAYVLTYWLSDDEVVQPTSSGFTGATSLVQLISRFSLNNPFCLSYLEHNKANAYGVRFMAPAPEPVATKGKKGKKKVVKKVKPANPTSGTYVLVDTDKASIFCASKETKTQIPSTWAIRNVHGTRVLELATPPSIEVSDVGIQPINAKAVTNGFAEIKLPRAGKKKGEQVRVIPVRIMKANEAIVDFRLKFNAQAAEVLRTALAKAAQAKAKDTKGN